MEPANQPTNQPTYQPSNQLASQPVSQPTSPAQPVYAQRGAKSLENGGNHWGEKLSSQQA